MNSLSPVIGSNESKSECNNNQILDSSSSSSSSSKSHHAISLDQEANDNISSINPTNSTTTLPPSLFVRLSSIFLRIGTRCCAALLPVLKRCYYIIVHILVIPLGAAILIAICSIAFMLMLLISVLVTRIFQFFRSGKDYEKLAQFKHLLRIWLTVIPPLAFIGLLLLYGIAKHIPYVNQVVVLELPLATWVVLITIMYGLCMFTSFLYLVVHGISALFMGRHSLNAGQANSEIIDGLVFWLAAHEVIKRVPSIQYHHEILGLATVKWISVLVLLLIGYNLITLFTRIIGLLLERVCQRPYLATSHLTFWQYVSKNYLRVRYVVYYANGMTVSISFVMSSLLLLLTWILYFGSRLDLKSTKVLSVWEYGTWTLVSLFVFSFLWLIKTCLLLAWEARTVYDRLQSRILSTCDQLYFLSYFSWQKSDFFKLKEEVRHEFIARYRNSAAHRLMNMNQKEENLKYSYGLLIVIGIFTALQGGFKPDTIKRRIARLDLLFPENADPNLNDIEQATQHFALDKQGLLGESYISDILDKFDRSGDNRKILKRAILGSEYSSDSEEEIEQDRTTTSSRRKTKWDVFLTKLTNINHENPNENIPFSVLQTWVERAHNQCMKLINTIKSAKEASDCLNKIISWLLFGAIFIMWLLLTGLATTKVLVLIASPLLAATFIFGNTCKTLFEGILFVFVIHPIDVGDLCFIDDTLMEVRSTGVWTTTFTKVEKFGMAQELMIYSNTDLANKTITNYKTKFDWSDHAEFSLSFVKNSKVQTQDDVINFIKKHLNEEQCPFLSRAPNLIAIAMEDSIKLDIHLEYKAEITKEWTYFECLREKGKLKGDFSLIMHDIISKFEAQGEAQPSQPSSLM